ncbi:Paramyosin [Blattella germanica]|nr:Paramyosin [Blattella germanica]
MNCHPQSQVHCPPPGARRTDRDPACQDQQPREAEVPPAEFKDIPDSKFIKHWPDQFLLMTVRPGPSKKTDEKRLTATEMRFMRRTAGCSLLEHHQNAEILEEIKIDPITEYIQQEHGKHSKQFLQANNTARELQKRTEHLEKVNIDIKTRLEETVVLYESTQRDLRVKVTEIQRITHELDKTHDLHDARNQLADLNRRFHELEIELRRLENEREELTAAYKEAEAGRKAEEQRAQRLSAELGNFRHEAERRLAEKDEEIESIR